MEQALCHSLLQDHRPPVQRHQSGLQSRYSSKGGSERARNYEHYVPTGIYLGGEGGGGRGEGKRGEGGGRGHLPLLIRLSIFLCIVN